MNYLTIFNTIVNGFIIVYLIYKHFPFYIARTETTWGKKLIGYNIMRITSRYDTGEMMTAKGIMYIPFRNGKKARKEDSELFKQGKIK